MNIVVVSGGFDPIHSGHISYMKSAKDIGDHLIVALNSDEWLIPVSYTHLTLPTTHDV